MIQPYRRVARQVAHTHHMLGRSHNQETYRAPYSFLPYTVFSKVLHYHPIQQELSQTEVSLIS